MKVCGIIGWSGSGKTVLIAALIPILRARGLRVSTIKHAHEAVAPDRPGKDSWAHAEAGAEEVILASPAGASLFTRRDWGGLDGLLARLAPVDLVLVEGFKNEPGAKLEVYRPAVGKPPLWHETAVMAVASDQALPDCQARVLDLADHAAIAHFLLMSFGLDRAHPVQE